MIARQVQATALAVALLLGCAGFSGAMAATTADQNTAHAADVHAVTTVASVSEPDDAMTNCSRSRRRLWVDGEGWIVRRVTTCH
ncbi:hypothetical protein G3T14_18990 [Methylobacterium sp. BTF04]|uniref:hypothetical protein n=1 Tax=Methylobacterium sp. BTF04 TaxID=2708300 RepID=UPI0013D51D3B|nr:hypothetical protein [Methylobacterium sp. BTF04]NEU14199.1 hypothetical protein [Methylobacterium sp. BTF04]